jgi:hypothetical protein
MTTLYLEETPAGAQLTAWYVDEYEIGYKITRRASASLERWPVSHGPFDCQLYASLWASKYFKEAE